MTLELEDLYQTAPDDVQAQYRDTNIHQLIQGIADIKKKYLGKGLESLRNDNLNITTAKENGLDMWGTLLHFYRYIPTDDSPSGTKYFNFNDRNFKKLQFINPNKGNYSTLDDTAYLPLIVLIYQKMFQPNTIPNMNAFIQNFFTDFSKIDVLDSTDMSTQVYVFYSDNNFPLWLKWVFDNYDMLPRPAGVGSSYLDKQKMLRFGFAPDGTTDTWYTENIGAFERSNFLELEE